MNTTVLKNGLVYTERYTFEPLDVGISEGSITQTAERITDAGQVIDCSGCYVLPGLVDIHLHGCAGSDVCDGSPASLDRIAAYEFSRGVTAFCPTTMTLPDERLKAVLANIAEYHSGGCRPGRAEIIGANLEGPFLSAEKCGAQATEHIRRPSAEKLREYQAAAGGLIRLVTVAPEAEGAAGVIADLAGELHFSLGHTAADYDAAAEAFAAGADHVTHLFNAMPSFHHRDTGVIGAAFDNGSCFAELICDGVHVSPSAVRAAFKLFGEERTVLVSDSMEAAGMTDGDYTLGGQRVIRQGSRAALADGTLAGSVTDLFGCMLTAVSMGVPLETAVRAATANPARSIGADDRFGIIAPGRAAHFLVLDRETLNIRLVI